MRRTKDVAEGLRYCPENNNRHGDWITNWDNGVRYVNPCGGIDVLESGVIHLTSAGDRNVDLRNAWRDRYGIDVINIDIDRLPAKMYAPNSNKAIPKNALLQTQFLVDHETGRVLALNQQRGPLPYAYWLHPGAPANTDEQLTTRERNLTREKEWNAKFAHDILIGRGICALNSHHENARNHSEVSGTLTAWLRGTVTTDCMHVRYQQALAFAMELGSWTDEFRSATADFKEYNYLCLKPDTYTLWA
jgi:hypothetical protein